MVGASNEMPEDKEELGALWDRFMLRYIVGDLKNPKNFEILMNGQNKSHGCTTITMQELAQVQAEVEAVDIRGIVPRLTELRQKINAELNIYNSPRRWKKAVKLVKAHAWLEGRAKATDDDLAILAATCWDEPAQVQEVRKTILALANPMDIEAQNIADEALELWHKAMNEQDESKVTKIAAEANQKLKKLTSRLDAMRADAKKAGKNETKIVEVMQQVLNINKEIVNKCLGIRL
jgi:MoxR-like ATPase